MPTYQYACTNPEDKHEFEVVQSFTDPAVSSCPECGAPVRKVYGSVGVVFKGSGFYRNDSRKAESAGANDSSSTSSTKESSSAGSKDGSKDSSSSKETPKETPKSAPAASKPSSTSTNSKAAN